MTSYDSGRASQDSHDEDDDGEYDEAGSGNHFLGFMFGNVDNSGDLDVDYLDEDAKEHLAALADKLGPSLADIDLSVKSPNLSAEAAEEGDIPSSREEYHVSQPWESPAPYFEEMQESDELWEELCDEKIAIPQEPSRWLKQ